jgi:hypothetical protein
MRKSDRTPLVIGLILAVAGAAIIGFGVQSMVFGASSAVECSNGEVIGPGEGCKFTNRQGGSTTTRSYSELKREKKSIVAPVAGIVIGSLLLLWGGVILLGAYPQRRE